MLNVTDLHIEDEILPLFDLTYNLGSGKAVREILELAPDSKAEILKRQQVLKGFISNREVFSDYSFSRFNLADVSYFLESVSAGSFFPLQMRRRLMFSEKERHHKRGKLIMLI